jgi:hypothetical protein
VPVVSVNKREQARRCGQCVVEHESTWRGPLSFYGYRR